ncbi:MAG: tRNA (adenosine(37)-N6)-threonylcarbamoyltransferase complex transferase subunit TsaD [Candidatus Taylorbacteria bacterium]
MIILGIETSCDETALALIETREKGEYRVIDSLVHSQAELHSAFGGVFPALAKREHSKNLVPLLKKLLESDRSAAIKASKTLSDEEFGAKMTALTNLLAEKNADLLESIKNADSHNQAGFLKNIPNIDCIAVTEGPGLEPALWVGINFALILSKLWNIPVKAVNHMEGHIVGSLLQSDKPYGTWQKLKELPLPALALLISGGHTELVKIESAKYTIIGQTKDDAVGEAFDKVARLLGLPYPGGPHISKLAHEAREKNIISPIKLPRPMLKSGDCDFSFSGLKTAVLYSLKKTPRDMTPEDFKAGLAREFEDSVADVLDSKLRRAIDEQDAKAIIIGGGVSANRLLRERFSTTAKEYDIPIFLPDHHISGDNALMIALVAAIDKTENTKIEANNLTNTPKADGTKKLY